MRTIKAVFLSNAQLLPVCESMRVCVCVKEPRTCVVCMCALVALFSCALESRTFISLSTYISLFSNCRVFSPDFRLLCFLVASQTKGKIK